MKKSEPMIIIDNYGGKQERTWVGQVSPTIKATHYKFPPCVMVITEDEDIDREEVLPLGGR